MPGKTESYLHPLRRSRLAGFLLLRQHLSRDAEHRPGNSLAICWGLHPRLDLGPGVFDFRLEPGSLDQASGRLPHSAGGWIEIQWRHGGQAIEYSCRSTSALELRRPREPPLRLATGQAATWSISSR